MQCGLDMIDRAVGAVLKPVLFAGMAGLIAVITLQILTRSFFPEINWTEEVARFLLVWTTFLGATIAFVQGRHIAVPMMVDALPPRWRRLALILAQIIMITVLVVLAVVGYRYMLLQSFQKTPSLRISMSYIYAIMPFSAAVMALVCATDLVRLCTGAAPRPPEGEGDSA